MPPASGGSEEALEGYRGHGLFTYHVLDAINRGGGDSDGTVELNELAAYVHAQVSEVSQRIYKQRQVPQIRITANHAFAKQTRILRDDAPLVAEAKPLVQLAQGTKLRVKPGQGASVVRSLSTQLHSPSWTAETGGRWWLAESRGHLE